MKIEQIKEEIADMVNELVCGECDYSSRCDGRWSCYGTVLANLLIDMIVEAER